jgi:ferrous iron transport protein B
MQSFTWSFAPTENAGDSILATISTPFAYFFAPIFGAVAWKLAAATITGFIAKENVVGTLAVCYGVTNFINTDELALTGGATEVAAVFGITKAAALACLMFNLFTPPCFAAIGAMNSEIKDKKWMFAGVGLQLATGYIVAFLIYQIGTLITKGTVGVGFVPGLIAVVVMVGTLIISFIVNYKLALVLVALIPLFIIIGFFYRKKILKKYRNVRKINSAVTAAFTESFAGANTSKTLGSEVKVASFIRFNVGE